MDLGVSTDMATGYEFVDEITNRQTEEEQGKGAEDRVKWDQRKLERGYGGSFKGYGKRVMREVYKEP